MYPMFLIARHAQSLHNSKTKELQAKYPENQSVKELPEYKEMKFSEELLDASITKEGEIECQKLKEALAGEEFDIVVVSPLRRALETCMLSIGEKNVKVFVEPLASEKMTSACDIGSKLKQSKALFEHYDFSSVGGRQEAWYLNDVVSPQSRAEIEETMEKKGEKAEVAALSLMKRGETLQSDAHLEGRVQALKKRLLYYKQKSTKGVLLITHACIIRALTATGFHENHTPINALEFKNAQVKHVALIIDNVQSQFEVKQYTKCL